MAATVSLVVERLASPTLNRGKSWTGNFVLNNSGKVFTSWRSEDDPSPGNFTQACTGYVDQIFIWKNGTSAAPGRWNEQDMVPTYIRLQAQRFRAGEEDVLYYTEFNSSYRYVSPDGVERHLILNDDAQGWHQYSAAPYQNARFTIDDKGLVGYAIAIIAVSGCPITCRMYLPSVESCKRRMEGKATYLSLGPICIKQAL
ncbi:hypothetical protein HPP92_015632 [Vanilla planifolia]|uniref:Uncharacterized protein n=1 Tax=Vanilla planifolia TaxID=51239 RepID=A0A835QL00_VANPL|nr:hypothetical protein HPP92_016332 [Vanilla planifolia]KAG0471086.1 hypothetical protein HPP92_015632 [Vanilla planifolia]